MNLSSTAGPSGRSVTSVTFKHRQSSMYVKVRASKGFGNVAPGQSQPASQSKSKEEPRGTTLKVPEKIIESKERVPLADKLGSISVVFVGDDSDLNNAVAAKFAPCAGYVPLTTQKVIEIHSGQSCAELEASEGRDFLVTLEISILKELQASIRQSVGTLGGGYAATARGDVWRHMYGAYTVWLDTKPEEDEASAPQREAYAQAELHVKLDGRSLGSSQGAESSTASSLEKIAEEVVAQVLPGLVDLVDKKPDLPKGKLLYMKLGCRGDWPEIMPPEWQPDTPEPLAKMA